MVARLPTALESRHRQAHDLTGVQDASMILMFVRSAILREECGRSRNHNQERSDSGFSQEFHLDFEGSRRSR
jgi:hypothetical protein